MLLAATSAAALKGEEPGAGSIPGWWGGDYATGTWGAVRDTTEEKGLDIIVEYTADAWANVSGGLQTGGAYLGLVQFRVDWDPQPLISGWKGALFRASGIYPYQTRSVTQDLVGDLNGIDNIEAPHGARLCEVWYQQASWYGRFSFQLGNLLVDENFAYNELATVLINSGFGWSQFMAANTGTIVPAYPSAGPGFRLEWQPSGGTYLQVGAYDGDALDNAGGDTVNNPDGTCFHLNRDQGVFAIAEFGYRLNQLDGDPGFPGTYKFGGFYHSATFDDLYYDDRGNSWIVSGQEPKTYSGNFMLYATAEQMFWGESKSAASDQGLGLFFRVGAGPDGHNPVNLVVDGGLQYLGLVPGRDEDTLGLGEKR